MYNINSSLVQASKRIDELLGKEKGTTDLGKKYSRDLKEIPGYQENLVPSDAAAQEDTENTLVSSDVAAHADAGIINMSNKNEQSFSDPYIHEAKAEEMDFTKLIDKLMDKKKGHLTVR